MADWTIIGGELTAKEPLEAAHERAIATGYPQCPKCKNGWLNYRMNNDQLVCLVCGYDTGKTEPAPADV